MNQKTNAMRILDQKKVLYNVLSYEVTSDEYKDGIESAEKLNLPLEKVFKTLVATSKSKKNYVFVIPVAKTLDLKLAAKLANEKNVELIHVKELLPTTGYMRGGCSPIGMKKLFPTFIDDSATNFDKIYISGGKIGTHLEINPNDLTKVIPVKFTKLTID